MTGFSNWHQTTIEMSDAGYCRCLPQYWPAVAFVDFDLWIAMSGHCRVALDGHQRHLHAGSVLLVPPGVSIAQWTGPAPFELIYVHFNIYSPNGLIGPEALHIDYEDFSVRVANLPTISLQAEMDTSNLGKLLLQNRHRLNNHAPQLETSVALTNVLLALLKEQTDPVSQQTLLADQIATFLEEEFSQDLSVPALAKRFELSTTHLARIFKARHGTSPIGYLTTVRMAAARELLLRSTLPIGDIARRCGYHSLPFFSRSFRRQHGISPRAFRHGTAIH